MIPIGNYGLLKKQYPFILVPFGHDRSLTFSCLSDPESDLQLMLCLLHLAQSSPARVAPVLTEVSTPGGGESPCTRRSATEWAVERVQTRPLGSRGRLSSGEPGAWLLRRKADRFLLTEPKEDVTALPGHGTRRHACGGCENQLQERRAQPGGRWTMLLPSGLAPRAFLGAPGHFAPTALSRVFK